jgi:hypothetical protein
VVLDRRCAWTTLVLERKKKKSPGLIPTKKRVFGLSEVDGR